jgi:PAS domain S-box-containing protein
MGYLTIDKHGIILEANLTATRLLGIERSKLISNSVFRFVPTQFQMDFNSFLKETFSSEKSQSIESIFKQQDGTLFTFYIKASTLQTSPKDELCRLAFIDISERKIIEYQLSQRNAQIQSLDDGIITVDANDEIQFINLAGEQLTLWKSEEIIGKKVSTVFQIRDVNNKSTYQDIAGLLKLQNTVREISRNIRLITKNKSELPIQFTASAIKQNQKYNGLIISFRDISEQILRDNLIFRNHELESLGTLAGGIAHDFNNILTIIMGNLSLLKDFHTNDDEYGRFIESAEIASVRAREITQRLITFSKGGEPIKKVMQIQPVIKEAIDFALYGSNIKPLIDLPEDLWWAEFDPLQILRVIQNIVSNAREAMPDGGTIEIKAENSQLKKSKTIPLLSGNYIKISITDHGKGISEEHLPKIFEPFFTTKKKGWGLGMPISKSIIQQHHGMINVVSEIEKGTTFTICLPALIDSHPLPIILPKTSIQKGSGSILLMDDELLLLESTQDLLKKLGYSVQTAENGDEAILLYQEAFDNHKPFDLVILDLTVPGGMGGLEAGKRILTINPSSTIVISSGYSAESIMAKYVSLGFSGIIPKPYDINDLSQVIYSLIRKENKK